MIRGVADGVNMTAKDYKEEDVEKVIDGFLKEHVLDPEAD